MRLCVIVIENLIWHVEHPRLNQAEEKANPTKMAVINGMGDTRKVRYARTHFPPPPSHQLDASSSSDEWILPPFLRASTT